MPLFRNSSINESCKPKKKIPENSKYFLLENSGIKKAVRSIKGIPHTKESQTNKQKAVWI